MTGLATDNGPHHDPVCEKLPMLEDSVCTEVETGRSAVEVSLAECCATVKDEVTVPPKVKGEYPKVETTDDTTLFGEETLSHG